MVAQRKRRLAVVVVLGLAGGAWGLTNATAAPGGDARAATGTEAALEACLSDRGHDVDVAADDPMVLSDAEVAARYGYGIVEPITVTGETPAATRDEGLGDDASQCADAVRPESAADRLQAAYGRLAASLTVDEAKGLRDLDSFIATLPGADAALASWQACMKDAGFDAESPGAARDSVEARLAEGADRGQLADAERKLAVADVGCRDSVLFPALIDVIDRHVANR